MKDKTAILIPARFNSTRLPGKPLKNIDGIPMIIRCAKNAAETGLAVYVATDSDLIKDVCDQYSIQSIMTPECSTGTDRLANAVEKIDSKYIINLQGDEPMINGDSIKKMVSSLNILKESEDTILNAVTLIGINKAKDINNVKCALIESGNLIQYFSRKPLLNEILPDGREIYYKQVGLYAMTRENLKKFASLKEGKLEKAERVELMRWIENGFKISSCILDIDPISVDTPKDLLEVSQIFSGSLRNLS